VDTYGSIAVPALIDKLGATDQGVRDLAASCLGDIGDPNPDAIQLLIGAMRSRTKRDYKPLASTAMEALSSFGLPAVRPLLAYLEDHEDELTKEETRQYARTLAYCWDGLDFEGGGGRRAFRFLVGHDAAALMWLPKSDFLLALAEEHRDSLLSATTDRTFRDSRTFVGVAYYLMEHAPRSITPRIRSHPLYLRGIAFMGQVLEAVYLTYAPTASVQKLFREALGADDAQVASLAAVRLTRYEPFHPWLESLKSQPIS
jgi:hypothetical protein